MVVEGTDEKISSRDDHVHVPPRAILVLERDQIAGGVDTCASSGMHEQQQRQQPAGLGLVR